MAHLEKFKRSDAQKVLKHDKRQWIITTRENIDADLTKYNYALVDVDPIERLNERIASAKTVRSNTNVISSWVITKPKDYNGDEKQFFNHCVKFLEDRYGANNVLSAVVHVDEPQAQPHLHYKFVPMTSDGRISAKEVNNRYDLQTFHSDLQKYLESELQINVSILNGATASGNRTVLQMRNERIVQQIDEMEDRITTLSEIEANQLENVNKAIQNAPRGVFNDNRVKLHIEDAKTLYKASEVTKAQVAKIDKQQAIIDRQAQHIKSLQKQLAEATHELQEREDANKKTLAEIQQAVRDFEAEFGLGHFLRDALNNRLRAYRQQAINTQEKQLSSLSNERKLESSTGFEDIEIE